MGTRVTKMIFKALVVLVVTAVVSCQDAELPIWWQAEPDAGQIPSDAWCGFTKACYDSAECDIQKYKNIKFNKSPTSSIIIPEAPLLFKDRQIGESVNICVNKNSEEAGFQLVEGKVGFCAGKCCSFQENPQ